MQHKDKLLKELAWRIFPVDPEDNNILSIIQYMPSDEEWMPFFDQLPSAVIQPAFYRYSIQWTMKLLKEKDL